jgi:hypothetical protein
MKLQDVDTFLSRLSMYISTIALVITAVIAVHTHGKKVVVGIRQLFCKHKKLSYAPLMHGVAKSQCMACGKIFKNNLREVI